MERCEKIKIYNLALQNIKDLAVDKHKTKEEHLVHCWALAFQDVLNVNLNEKKQQDIIIEPD